MYRAGRVSPSSPSDASPLLSRSTTLRLGKNYPLSSEAEGHQQFVAGVKIRRKRFLLIPEEVARRVPLWAYLLFCAVSFAAFALFVILVTAIVSPDFLPGTDRPFSYAAARSKQYQTSEFVRNVLPSARLRVSIPTSVLRERLLPISPPVSQEDKKEAPDRQEVQPVPLDQPHPGKETEFVQQPQKVAVETKEEELERVKSEYDLSKDRPTPVRVATSHVSHATESLANNRIDGVFEFAESDFLNQHWQEWSQRNLEFKLREPLWSERRDRVLEMAQHAANGYVPFWGHDEVRPCSNQSNDSWGGFGVTAIDAIDTFFMFGMKAEFELASRTARKIDWKVRDYDASLFETTIRYLGGLLSAFQLSKLPHFLEKAKDLADLLLEAFPTVSEDSLSSGGRIPDDVDLDGLSMFDVRRFVQGSPYQPYKLGLPNSIVNLQSGRSRNPLWTGGRSILSEVGSVQLELKFLSVLTGNPKYFAAAEASMNTLELIAERSWNDCEGDRKDTGLKGLSSTLSKKMVPYGLWALYLDGREQKFSSNRASVGALADSFFEYLLKQSLLFETQESRDRETTDRHNRRLEKLYDISIDAILQHMLVGRDREDYTFISDLHNFEQTGVVDHLTCFFPGMLALGAKKRRDKGVEDLRIASRLVETCASLYFESPSGLSPDQIVFNLSELKGPTNLEKSQPPYQPFSNQYLLRPETIESLFYLWRMTDDQKYREWGWKIFLAIEKQCKTPLAYSGISNVARLNQDGFTPQNDSMQSFFFAETLKYLYLLFSPKDELDLSKYVFNTEGHIFGVTGLQ